MSAPETVPRERIREVVTKWKGNIQAAADELGLNRNNLRERVQRMGLDLEALRHPTLEGRRYPSRVAPPIKGSASPRGDPLSRVPPPLGGTARKSGTAIFQSGDGKPRLIGMQTAARDEQPIKTTRKPLAHTRLLPDQQEELREAKYDIQARFRTDLGESEILQQFFYEEFPGWKARKLAAADKGGDGGGGESGSDVS